MESITFGYKSLKVLGPKICNNLPYHVKYSDNLDTFKIQNVKIVMETCLDVIYVKTDIY